MDVKQLYTAKIDTYLSFNAVFRSPQALQAFFDAYPWLHSGLRILDAGCGTGTAALALVRALRRRNLDYQTLHAFDLTPAMLARFQEHVTQQKIANVHLREANVLALERLPPSWTNYDLIVSVAMLEYVPRADMVTALTALRTRLARDGRLLLFITRKNWITKLLIERWWKANRYTREELREAFMAAGLRDVTFKRFPYAYFWQNLWAYILESQRW
jgi:cyclopropane fatty-acyl-phospholipid synthase-like methyltransferase